ncbi:MULTISPECIES: hypothetical protein [unclassified Helicobacter]|nr:MULTISPECIES: hypothetical protein [unclassified Helicobacter]
MQKYLQIPRGRVWRGGAKLSNVIDDLFSCVLGDLRGGAKMR